MKNTAIIIPTRLEAKRFPNKSLAKINNVPMIIHVLTRARESKVGEVFVATPNSEICDIVKKHGGQAILTKNNHPNGTSRVFEAFTKIKDNNVDLIINLQGDMPNIKPSAISKLEKLMKENNCSIGTLASTLTKDEINDENVVKVEVETDLKEDSFLKAKNFFRIKKDLRNEKIYHHVGIYCFQSSQLKRYVELGESKQEKILKLEQIRLMGNIEIKVGYCGSNPLSIDTLEDLKRIEKEMS